MKRTEIKHSLRRAVEAQTPDVLDAVLLQARGAQAAEQVFMPQKSKRSAWMRYVAVAAVLALLLTGGLGGYRYYAQTDSVIAIDVNPSITLQVNRWEKVTQVDAGNAQAQQVLADMDLKRVDLHVAVNAILGSMVRLGYITAENNSVLISVEQADSVKGSALQAKLLQEVSGILESYNLEGAVLSQTVQQNDTLQALAEQYGITLGKAQLIEQLVQADSSRQFADFVHLNVNELNLLLTSAQGGENATGGHHGNGLQQNGHASTAGYISQNAALKIALQHAGLGKGQVHSIEIEMDYNNHKMEYEVEFICRGVEYSYEIDAVSGEILESEMDDDEHHDDHE